MLVTKASVFNVYGNDLISQGGATASSRQYYLTDGLGNVKYLTNSSGTVLNTYSYDPWGGNQTTNGTTANSYVYQAEQKDSESSLVYLRARYYDPSTGRFTSTDPSSGTLDNPLTQNGYNYANNNPINMMDPTGMNALTTLMKITGLQAYQNSIAQNCSWGAIAGNGAMAVLNMGMLIPGGGEADAAAQGVARGLEGIAKAQQAEYVLESAQSLNEQLALQEAVGVAGQAMGNINRMIISAQDVGDPLYQDFEKWQYEHISLDGTKTIVHYMYNSTTKEARQVKIP